MASKDSVRYLGASIGDLGNTFAGRAQQSIENARSDRNMALQEKYFAQTQAKQQEEAMMRKKQEAMGLLQTAVPSIASELLSRRKIPLTEENLKSVEGEAYRLAISKMGPEAKALLGGFGEMISRTQAVPGNVYSSPIGPQLPPGGMPSASTIPLPSAPVSSMSRKRPRAVLGVGSSEMSRRASQIGKRYDSQKQAELADLYRVKKSGWLTGAE